MIRTLFLLALACAPSLALVACAASNGDALPPEVREAGTREADPLPRGKAEEPDADDGDAPADAGKDARADADAATLAVVHINEIYVDIDGLGDGAEFVELRVATGSKVDDLKLRIIDANGEIDHVVSVGVAGDVVGGSGLWVVGGSQTFKLGAPDRIDRIVPLADWGLPTARGAVQLVRGTQLLDVVSWSQDADAGAIAAVVSAPTSTGEGSPASVPTITKTAGNPAHSFGRRSAAPDTNDNRADFCSMAVSPGHEQKVCD
jgi:hypothetical protein